MKSLTFITGNPNKATQVARYLNFPIEHHSLDLPEIQSLDLKEIATQKAEAAYAVLQSPVLVEDTALTFTALNGLPGPLIKWFLESIGNIGLCKLLDSYDDKTAVAQTCFALRDESGVQLFIGERMGVISSLPKGEDFGWNPIFIPDGQQRTWGEMSIEESRATSMRRLAIEQLQAYLHEHHQ